MSNEIEWIKKLLKDDEISEYYKKILREELKQKENEIHKN